MVRHLIRFGIAGLVALSTFALAVPADSQLYTDVASRYSIVLPTGWTRDQKISNAGEWLGVDTQVSGPDGSCLIGAETRPEQLAQRPYMELIERFQAALDDQSMVRAFLKDSMFSPLPSEQSSIETTTVEGRRFLKIQRAYVTSEGPKTSITMLSLSADRSDMVMCFLGGDQLERKMKTVDALLSSYRALN